MGRAEDIFERMVAVGMDAIDEFIETRASEELFLDFKRSSDKGDGRRLSDIDRGNLAKAISGFGNSEGGVIVWGIDCSNDPRAGDVARFKVPIVDPARFKSWLEGVVSGCTVPPHPGVRHHAISNPNSTQGFVVTLIPASVHSPHQVVGRSIYCIRAGSDFVPAPHGVLAGMFGRRPQAVIRHDFLYNPAEFASPQLRFKLTILIQNLGPVSARELYLSLTEVSNGPGGSKVGFLNNDHDRWSHVFSLGRQMSMVSLPDCVFPPQAVSQPLLLLCTLQPPFEGDIELAGILGSANGPPQTFRPHATREHIERAYYMVAHSEGSAEQAILHRVPRFVFGLPPEE